MQKLDIFTNPVIVHSDDSALTVKIESIESSNHVHP